MALKVQRGAQTTDQKREREREGGEAQSSEEKARVSSARFFLFFFGWVMGGGVYLGYLCACRPTHTCAHVDQNIRHLEHPANLKSELSKHHLEPGP